MKNYLLIITLLFFLQVKAQTPDWVWTRIASSTIGNFGEGTSIAIDKSDNVYITGWYNGTITFDSIALTSPQGTFLTKYDSSGNLLWAKTQLGGQAFGSCVTTDKYGNAYIVGSFEASVAFGSFILFSAGTEDIFVVKYDPSGNVIWAKNAGGLNHDQGRGITSDAFGNIYITGNFSSSIFNIGPYTLTNSSGNNIFLAKYDPSGNVIWAKSSPIGNGYGYGISSDAIGNVYIAGDYFSAFIIFGNDTLTIAHNNSSDIYLAKYDSSGNELWAKSAGGTNNADAFYVATDDFNNVYLTGQYDSPSIIFGSTTLTNYGLTDGFFVKYNSFGNVLWAKNIEGTGYESGWGIAPTNENKVYLTGGFTSQSINIDTITLTQPPGSIDPMFIAAFDTLGNIFFAKGTASGGDDNIGIATSSSSSCFYVGGDFESTILILGNDTIVSGNGLENVFVSKLCYPNDGVNISEVSNRKSFVLYPTPFADNLNVRINGNEQTEIFLYDILSRKQLIMNFTNSTTINTSELSSGIYFFELRNKNGIIATGKIVKQ